MAPEVLPGCSPARANAPPRSHSSLFGLNGLRLVEALQRRRLPTENGSASAASRSAESVGADDHLGRDSLAVRSRFF